MGQVPLECQCTQDISKEPSQGFPHGPAPMSFSRAPGLPAGPALPDGVLRPFVYDLREESRRILPNLNGRNLALVWQRCAERRLGTLQQDHVQIIQSSAAAYLEAAGVHPDANIDLDALATYMLGVDEHSEALQAVQRGFHNAVRGKSSLLEQAFKICRRWDQRGDGLVTASDLGSCLRELGEKLGIPSAKISRAISHILQEGDVMQHDHLDLWHALSETLGRRRVPVEIMLYDLSRGTSNFLSPMLLGHHVEAIYHCSVVAFGFEFWYGGKIWRNKQLPQHSVYGEPMMQSSVMQLEPSAYAPDVHVLRVGFTLATYLEFTDYLCWLASSKYRPDRYDEISHNCTQFADDCIQFLAGVALPTVVTQNAAMLMASGMAQTLRPVVNRFFGDQDAYSCSAKGSTKDSKDLRVTQSHTSGSCGTDAVQSDRQLATDEHASQFECGTVAI